MPPPETTGQLAIQVLRQHAAAFMDHASSAGSGDDPREIHQTRVATRRMRAALRLFQDLLPSEASSLHDELAWIAGQLGPARDLDVQVHRLRQSAVKLGVSAALVPYGAWLEGQRLRAQRELDDALKSPRFEELIHQLHGLQDWAPNPATDTPVGKDGPHRLRMVFKRLKKSANRVHPDSPSTDLHQVRIRAKRLRYTAEFFESLYGKPARRLVERTVALQDLLGELQDGVVSSQHIHEAVQTSGGTWPAETSLALGQILQYDTQRCARVRDQFPAAYENVRDKGWRGLVSKVAMS